MWTLLSFLIGSWQGTGSGKPGTSQVRRSYQFVLGDKFIQVTNTSTYPPQEQNPNGEVHDDIGYISHDTARNTFVFRQFHLEGFVNQYVAEPIAADQRTITLSLRARRPRQGPRGLLHHPARTRAFPLKTSPTAAVNSGPR